MVDGESSPSWAPEASYKWRCWLGLRLLFVSTWSENRSLAATSMLMLSDILAFKRLMRAVRPASNDHRTAGTQPVSRSQPAAPTPPTL
jgi:hypothetical protein